MNKKLLSIIILTFILILGGLFFAYQSFIVGDKAGDLRDTEVGKEGRDTLFPSTGLFSGEKGDSTSKGANDSISTLRQISSAPASGGIVFNTGENTIIRYVERATGHIFETTNNSLEQNRISNTTIPRIQKSAWSPKGDMIILQYLDENEILKSFYGEVSSNIGVLEGWFLSNNITDIDVHKDGDIFYVQKIGNNAKGVISNFDGTNSRTIYSSTISDWLPKWMGNSATITTKSSRDISGIMYLLQPNNYDKILSAGGLIVNINPSGTKILFSISNTIEMNLFIYDRDDEKIIEVPFRTLAEKCTWSNDSSVLCASPYNLISGVLPDDWYKGLLSFSDDIWSYDTKTGETLLVFDAEADNKAFDAIDLTVDSEGETLLFTNKKDLTLWALSLK